MNEWLRAITEPTIVIIDAVAFAIIVGATLQVVIRLALAVLRGASNHDKRTIGLDYARWLVAALTFQLAADIIESSISTSWESIGRLGAVAVIRTFLEYFLGRDVTEWRERQHERHAREA
ncbi:MAG TPA: DUF1622 domain-containing protein [Gammaproteobacteria bacterium]|nr:DUF1622 domain-containing protein [Gammaproteobacteria bacterium]